MATKTSSGFIDAYEQAFQTIADYQEKVADQTKVDWIADIARAQAGFTRDITHVYASAAREVLR